MASLTLPPPRKSTKAPLQLPPVNSVKTETALVVSSLQQEDELIKSASTRPKKPLRAPSYEQRCRAAAEISKMTPEERRSNPKKLFVPRRLEDFDDGGAFPEIHVAQYPRHMGNPHLKKKASATNGFQSTSRAIVNVEVDKDGEISYDAIVKGGTNSDKKVYSPVSYTHLTLPTILLV